MVLSGALRAGVFASIAIVVAGSMTAEAREGFYLGAGFAETSIGSGGFDGSTTQTDTSGNKYERPKIGGGTGLSLDIGYNFTNYFGLEYFSSATTHMGTF